MFKIITTLFSLNVCTYIVCNNLLPNLVFIEIILLFFVCFLNVGVVLKILNDKQHNIDKRE